MWTCWLLDYLVVEVLPVGLDEQVKSLQLGRWVSRADASLESSRFTFLVSLGQFDYSDPQTSNVYVESTAPVTLTIV